MKADDLNRYFNNFAWLVGWTVVVLVVLLLLFGCAAIPNIPQAGPQQKTATVIANPNCIANCDVQISQSTALEDIKNNSGPITAGAQNQSTTQSSTKTSTSSPTTTTTTQKEKDD